MSYGIDDIWGVPTTFKFNSTLELGKQIEKMGWPCVERSAAGNYATSDACIQEWKRQNQPGIKELIQLRESENNYLFAPPGQYGLDCSCLSDV